jgi:hypothetical protein
MDPYIENDPRYQAADAAFMRAFEYLELTKNSIDEAITTGSLTASRIEMLIEAKLEVRESSRARVEAVNAAWRELGRRETPVKKPFWKRLLKK